MKKIIYLAVISMFGMTMPSCQSLGIDALEGLARMAGDVNDADAIEAMKYMKSNPAESARRFHALADKGYVPAETVLGGMYMEGKGVQKDTKIGRAWLQKAADHGENGAQCALGKCYLTGKYDVPKDRAKGMSYIRKAAAQGNTEAKQILANNGRVDNF